MRVEVPATDQSEPLRSVGGGITSPYADPPLASVFVIRLGDFETSRGQFTLTVPEDEARILHAALEIWIDEIARRKAGAK